MKSIRLILAIGLIILIMNKLNAQNIPYGSNEKAGHYLNVGDANIYYEVYGKGKPILLLHGGMFGYIDEYKIYIPVLSKNFKVIAVATRGHGKSEVGSTPFSYNLFANDAIKVLKNESQDSATIIGFSDGAITAYLIAAKYPNIAKKVVALAGGLDQTGLREDALESMRKMNPEDIERDYPNFVKERKKLMPDPNCWIDFMKYMILNGKQSVFVTFDEAKNIRCPVLTIGGDRDNYFKTEQFVRIYNTIPNSQLAIIPKSGHVAILFSSIVFNDFVLPFVNQ